MYEETEDGVRTKPDALPELLLDVYDFLRLCPQHRMITVSDRAISIPLASLYEEINRTVGQLRSTLEEKAMASKGQPLEVSAAVLPQMVPPRNPSPPWGVPPPLRALKRRRMN